MSRSGERSTVRMVPCASKSCCAGCAISPRPIPGSFGDAESDLVGISSVHPMSRDAVRTLLAKNNADWGVVESLMERGAMAEVKYQGRTFYVRRLPQAEGRDASRLTAPL